MSQEQIDVDFFGPVQKQFRSDKAGEENELCSPLSGGCSEDLSAFKFLLKHYNKRPVAIQREMSVKVYNF